MIRDVFPCSIYYEPLTTPAKAKALNKEILREIEIMREIDDEGVAWSENNYVSGYTSYASMNQLWQTSPSFLDLSRLIDKHVMRLAKHLDFDLQGGKLKMSTCWVNHMPPGAHHSGHIHPLSVISGTYYVDVPRVASALKFEDPRLAMMMAAPPAKDTASIRNQRTWVLKPEAGHVVLFESWMRHEVPANTSKRPRVSVSFNYEWI